MSRNAGRISDQDGKTCLSATGQTVECLVYHQTLCRQIYVVWQRTSYCYRTVVEFLVVTYLRQSQGNCSPPQPLRVALQAANRVFHNAREPYCLERFSLHITHRRTRCRSCPKPKNRCTNTAHLYRYVCKPFTFYIYRFGRARRCLCSRDETGNRYLYDP